MTVNAPKTGRTTYHRDGTVTLWDVYAQGWTRAAGFSDDVYASLDHRERCRVSRHCGETLAGLAGAS